jgi:hypothetical protein
MQYKLLVPVTPVSSPQSSLSWSSISVLPVVEDDNLGAALFFFL